MPYPATGPRSVRRGMRADDDGTFRSAAAAGAGMIRDPAPTVALGDDYGSEATGASRAVQRRTARRDALSERVELEGGEEARCAVRRVGAMREASGSPVRPRPDALRADVPEA